MQSHAVFHLVESDHLSNRKAGSIHNSWQSVEMPVFFISLPDPGDYDLKNKAFNNEMIEEK